MGYRIVTFRCNDSSANALEGSNTFNTAIQDFISKEKLTGSKAFYGQFVEDASLFIALVEVGNDAVAAKSEAVSSSRSIGAKDFTVYSTQLEPAQSIGRVMESPIVEVVFYYFPAALSDENHATIMSSTDKMRPVMQRSEAIAIGDGWADGIPRLSDHGFAKLQGENKADGIEDQRAKVYINVVGWESVDAHMRFQASQDFADNIHLILGFPEMRGADIMHVKLYSA